MRSLLLVLALCFVSNVGLAEDKFPLPDAAAKAEALKLLKEIFKDDLAQAKAADAKRTLAAKLLRQAGEEKAPANKLVLLEESARLSAEAGDAKGARDAASDIAKAFAVDEVALLKGALEKAKPTAKEDLVVLAEAWLGLADKAVMADNLEAASAACGAAESAARAAREIPLVSRAQAKGKEIGSAKVAWEAAKKAYEVLVNKPDDPAACLAVGKWLVLWKDNGGEGLPLLAKSSDAILKAAAERDLALAGKADETRVTAELAAEMAKAGDGWWEYAQKAGDAVSPRAKARATWWYRKALPGLEGLAKAAVEKRISEPGATGATRFAEPERQPSQDILGSYRLATGVVVCLMKDSKCTWSNGEKTIPGKWSQSSDKIVVNWDNGSSDVWVRKDGEWSWGGKPIKKQ